MRSSLVRSSPSLLSRYPPAVVHNSILHQARSPPSRGVASNVTSSGCICIRIPGRIRSNRYFSLIAPNELYNHKIHATRRLRAAAAPFSSSSSAADHDPLEIVQQAMQSLEEFSTKLRQLAQQVDEPHIIEVKSLFQSKPISLAEITLHSRDAATMEDFQTPLAHAARTELLVQAQHAEASLQSLIDLYTTTVQPQMERATQLCQETPCGGATWELDLERLQNEAEQQQQQQQQESLSSSSTTTTTTTPDGNQRISLRGEHGTLDGTPCGRLQVASLQFLETTLTTKPQILMASRARIILELSHLSFKAPLQMIRKNGTAEHNQTIKRAFQSQVLPTPWIRSDADYQELMQLKQRLVSSSDGGGGGSISSGPPSS
jgi:hypothetical protein